MTRPNESDVNLLAGIYRHYRGHLYLVLGFARDSNLPGRTAVVYVGLQLDDATTGHRMNIRTVKDFFAQVNPDTGAVVGARWDGRLPQPVKRFSYVGPTVPTPGGEG